MPAERAIKSRKQIADEQRINERRSEAARQQAQQRAELWNELRDYIATNGGWVTSVPLHKRIRFETEPGSSLPTKLRKSGYSVYGAGSTMRTTGSKPAITQVHVYEFDIA